MEKAKKASEFLKINASNLDSKKVMIGFDAFVDMIVRLVRNNNGADGCDFFEDIGTFGEYLTTKKGKSCGIEMKERFTKLGGNAAIMSNAIGSIGVKNDCICGFGYPSIEKVFNEMSSNSKLVTIGTPGYTTALEFDDGKIMLSLRDPVNLLDYDSIVEKLGFDTLSRYFKESDLISMVNWSCMSKFNSIWQNIIENILPSHTPNKKQIIFIDLADISDKPSQLISEGISLMEKFNEHYKVVLGLNENETNSVYKALFPDGQDVSLTDKGSRIFNETNIDLLVVHTLKTAIAFTEAGFIEEPNLFVKRPKLSTGGGDNFNAGLCTALLLDATPEAALYIANATSGFYVRNGFSPTVKDIIETLANWDSFTEE